MKKILFAALVAVIITFVSCAADAIEQNSTPQSANSTEMTLSQKSADTTGGQGGQIPPPPPPVTP